MLSKEEERHSLIYIFFKCTTFFVHDIIKKNIFIPNFISSYPDPIIQRRQWGFQTEVFFLYFSKLIQFFLLQDSFISDVTF